MEEYELYWQSYLSIEDDFLNLSKYILFADEEVVDKNTKKTINLLETFSGYIADLFIRCCTEIEALTKRIYTQLRLDYGLPSGFDSRTYPENPDMMAFDKKCFNLLIKAYNLNGKLVYVNSAKFKITKKENLEIYPFSTYELTDSNGWQKAYQSVKHDRFGSLKNGNIKNLLHALAGLYLLNLYFHFYNKPYGNYRINILNYIDWNFGSKIFYVKKPDLPKSLWKDNVCIENESPFIYQYDDSVMNSFTNKINNLVDSEIEFIKDQPEYSDPDFQNYLQENNLTNIENDFEKINHEFYKFKLKKETLNVSFEERKSSLLKTPEWKAVKNSKDLNIKKDDINETNIEDVIDKVATIYGDQILDSKIYDPFYDYEEEQRVQILIPKHTDKWTK